MPNAGPLIPVDAGGNQLAGFTGATGLDFTTTGELTPGVPGDIAVAGASGDFAIFEGVVGIIADFSFAGSGSLDYPLPPIEDFEIFAGGLSFDLDVINIVLQTDVLLVLEGSGIFNLAGFEPTDGTFEFAANDTGMTFSFSASQSAGPNVGGTVEGLEPLVAVCRNLVSGQSVTITLFPADTAWDCEAAGLSVAPGDRVLQYSLGTKP